MGNDSALAVPVRQVAHDLRLLQAVVRADHQPAHRLHPRGSGDVAGPASSGPEGNLLETTEEHAHRLRCIASRSSPTTSSTAYPGDRTTAAGSRAPSTSPSSAAPDVAGHAGRARPHLRRGKSEAIRRGLLPFMVLSDRNISAERVARSAHLAACGGGAPPPGAHQEPHPGRHHPGDRRGPGSASPLPAGGIRRRRQSTPTSPSRRSGTSRLQDGVSGKKTTTSRQHLGSWWRPTRRAWPRAC